MYPDLPTSLSGAYVIESSVDESCAANYVTRLGKPFGVYLDDTTPRLDYYIDLAVKKYGPLNQTVFVCVPTGERELHHKPCPPIVNLYEWYPFGEGIPENEFLPPPKFEGYIVQWNWPGTQGKQPPTSAQRQKLLAQVQAHHPKFIFLF